MKDKLFTQNTHKQFEFDAQVASVFDDMLERSIPHYREVLDLIVDFCMLNLSDGIQNVNTQSPLIYDLGSSTGSTLLALYHAIYKENNNMNAKFVGIDNSQAMIEKARLKAQAYGAKISFEYADLLEYDFLPSRIILANYILQFIRPMQRQNLLQKIYDSLESGGILIVSEKMTSHHRILDRQMIERYLRYKIEQGYTQYEINKKREALENVLIPFSLEENMALLKNVGFSGAEVLFKWVNFGSIIAVK
ncbi:carboxy-S-adenosyl-L-methionine synthase CmoA [Helicobacter cinaedi]|uniref:carboxy-S-adenosyl-L-methionine synthase CmoA n=1 Tax=Helicobacter cinaedi TaxID=213 RepID=UPI000CF178C5|nr:carboxy-S-adenosyl-L-methionine synthase CmoA [Helicobacter cinaedi]AWK61779.1 carboxy-S-adenosyl-L-methionine synthase CmoA [Helicobacter cinaedi]QOQ95878.1 carboxy-S-adenosyl-L-methionine synthase CmoA [Helicobacter cinaedi]